MNVTVNGDPKTIENGAVIAHVVAMTVGEGTGRGIAVAVNGAVVPRGEWDTTFLHPDDRVEILTAVAGG